MSHTKGNSSEASNDQQMQQLRELVLGDDGQYVTEKLKVNARDLVSEVFSEALHDREKQDGSVNNVLLPLVEKSVEKSVSSQSEQFVGYLYPLVGSLVRKSVTAFITEFLEKTNTLLENSLTIKGLKWRFRAWQSGVSFSQYAASQTFAFRVEQVFLIHRETGLLLNSVSLGLDAKADADLVSSMLTAINDFVSDSFKPNLDSSEQHLDVVRTDDFSLLIKLGPKAMVVASITGNMPQGVANRLQQTLEEIHKLYDKELNQFDGDPVPFENSQHQLRECLVSELKPEQKENKKKPWMAWILVALFFLVCAYLAAIRWQTNDLLQQVEEIDNEPGILLKQIDTSGLRKVRLEVLRDPAAISVKSWLKQESIPEQNLIIRERAYLSLEPELIRQKVMAVVAQFPSISVTWSDELPTFSGSVSNLDKLLLKGKLEKLVGLNFQASWLDNLLLEGNQNNTAADDPQILQAILDLNIAKIDKVTVAFEKGESELSPQALSKLIYVKEQFNDLVEVAERQELSLGLVIMGSSDTLGSADFNKILSQKRANNVKLKLQELGVAENRLNAIGLGAIDLKTSKEGARKVLFNVVYFESD